MIDGDRQPCEHSPCPMTSARLVSLGCAIPSAASQGIQEKYRATKWHEIDTCLKSKIDGGNISIEQSGSQPTLIPRMDATCSQALAIC